MKILIITVAGMSTRFSKSVGKDVIKCLYNDTSIADSLISHILHKAEMFDKYIIVGGYRYSELQSEIMEHFPEFADKLEIIENKYYEKYGSGYSLYCGMKKALKYSFDEIVFAEGDLFFDAVSFSKVCCSQMNVITYNNEPIIADKAVAFYLDTSKKIHYIYDIYHNSLEINEPFISIYNSGQVWKLVDKDKICETYNNMNMTDWEGTNLVFIEKYFNAVNSDALEIIRLDSWVNCNTVNDYHKIKEMIR